MEPVKRILSALFIVCLLLSAIAPGERFDVPANIRTIEGEAFADARWDSVFVPRSVGYLAPDAFGENVNTVYGFLNTAGQAYAQSAGKRFVPVDITDIRLDCEEAVLQGDTVHFEASARSEAGGVNLSIRLEKNGQAVAEGSESLAFAPDAGLYDVRVRAENGFDAQEAFYPGQVRVFAPIQFLGDPIVLDVGQTLPLLKSEETRRVEIGEYASDVLSADGLNLTGLTRGQTALTVRVFEGDKSICEAAEVRVYEPATSLSLPSSLTVTIYEEAVLTASVKPAGANPMPVRWTSSDETVAGVDREGRVYARSGGSAVVTAYTASGKTAACRVTVKETKPTRLTANAPYVSLTVGESAPLGWTIAPEQAQNKTASFISSDESVATVDDNGVVTAHKAGRTTVTFVSNALPSVTDTCIVIVTNEGAGRLAGTVIGINPGHQKVQILTQYPIAPGSSTMKPGCQGGATGVVTHKDECEVNLEVSLKLRQLLEQAGATVVMTRTSNDVSINNIDRADILNRAGVDAAIQVHANGGGASVKGMSSYYRSTGEYVDESKLLAESLLSGMLAATGAVDKGVHINNQYMSLNWSFTPAALVEMGFLTNREEDLLLSDESYQWLLAQGMVDGLAAYFGR